MGWTSRDAKQGHWVHQVDPFPKCNALIISIRLVNTMKAPGS